MSKVANGKQKPPEHLMIILKSIPYNIKLDGIYTKGEGNQEKCFALELEIIITNQNEIKRRKKDKRFWFHMSLCPSVKSTRDRFIYPLHPFNFFLLSIMFGMLIIVIVTNSTEQNLFFSLFPFHLSLSLCALRPLRIV